MLDISQAICMFAISQSISVFAINKSIGMLAINIALDMLAGYQWNDRHIGYQSIKRQVGNQSTCWLLSIIYQTAYWLSVNRQIPIRTAITRGHTLGHSIQSEYQDQATRATANMTIPWDILYSPSTRTRQLGLRHTWPYLGTFYIVRVPGPGN